MKKVEGNLTKHLTIDDYGVHQTEAVYISENALKHAKRVEKFIVWLNKKEPPKINAWYRSKAYNAKVGGVKNSLHLTGEATDLGIAKFSTYTEERIAKYAKKWKKICEDDGVVGEFGTYSWGIHLGSNIKYSRSFYRFDKR